MDISYTIILGAVLLLMSYIVVTSRNERLEHRNDLYEKDKIIKKYKERTEQLEEDVWGAMRSVSKFKERETKLRVMVNELIDN